MEARMNFLNNFSYTKTTAISLLLHGTLFGFLVILGPFGSVDPPVDMVNVEVEIVPASVIDIGDTANEPSAAASLPAKPTVSASSAPAASPPKPVMSEPTPPRAIEAAAHTEPLPPAMLGESGETSVAKNISPGSGTVDAVVVGSSNKGDGSEDGGGAQTPANYLYGPKPSYPQDARRAGWEGVVVLRILVNTDGSAATVSVRESSGFAMLDEAAVQGVKKWRFSPAKKAGTPIASFHDVRVRFRLVDAS
jgi:protein TonB